MIWLYNSRIIATLAVIIVHISTNIVKSSPIGSEYWWFGNLYESLSRWCVPVFVMISGALLLDQNKQEELSVFYKKRLSRILWPILFWSAFYLFWVFLKGIEKGDPPSIVALMKRLLSGKPYFHMWFLYMISGLYLFTPFFRKIIAHSTDLEIKFLVIFMFIIAALDLIYNKLYTDSDSILFIIRFIRYIPYFFMGYIIRQTIIIPSKFVLFSIFIFSFLTTAFGCYLISILANLSKGLYFYHYLSVTIIPMSISIMFILKKFNNPLINEITARNISSLTLGIFLIHPLILEIINRIYKAIGFITFHPALCVPVNTFFAFAISLMIAWIISKTPYVRRII